MTKGNADSAAMNAAIAKAIEGGESIEKIAINDDGAANFAKDMAVVEALIDKMQSEAARLTQRLLEMGLLSDAIDKEVDFAVVIEAALVGLAPVDPANIVPDPYIAELQKQLQFAQEANDAAAKRIAQLEAAGAEIVEEVLLVEVKRPKIGSELTLPQKAIDPKAVFAELVGGGLLQVVLTDDNSQVLSCRPLLGGMSMFEIKGDAHEDGGDPQLLLIDPIIVAAEEPRAAVREAWLLGANGKAIAKCRLSVDLIGGGGLEAKIPTRHLNFRLTE